MHLDVNADFKNVRATYSRKYFYRCNSQWITLYIDSFKSFERGNNTYIYKFFSCVSKVNFT